MRCRICETASLGVWVGTGSRDEARRTSTAFRICSSTWRSRARRRARRARSPRRSRRSAATSTPRPAPRTTAYFARVLKADVPLALDVLSDILAEPDLRGRTSSSASRTSSCRRSAPREDAPDDLVFEHLAGTVLSRAADRPLDARHAEIRCGSFGRQDLRAYLLARNYRAPNMVVAAAGAVDHEEVVRRGREALRRASPHGRGAGRRSRRASAAARMSTTRDLEQAHLAAGAAKACRSATRNLYSLQVFTNVLGGGMSSRLFQEVREKRGLCYSISSLPLCPMPTPACSASTPAPTPADAPELMNDRRRRDEQGGAMTSTRSRSPAPRRR